MRSVRAITFDLDDTLWEIGPVIRRAEHELWSWLTEQYPEVPRRYAAEDLLRLRHQVQLEHSDRAHDFRFLRKKVLEKVALECGYTTAMVDPAFDVFDAARNTVEFYPDVFPALQELAAEFLLIAVTNGNANLQMIGIEQHFSAVVTAVDVGSPKPERAIFDEAVRRCGVSAAEVLHVGDHPELDVQGASDAGMHTAWVNRNEQTWPQHLQAPDAEISAISEIRSLLRRRTTAR